MDKFEIDPRQSEIYNFDGQTLQIEQSSPFVYLLVT